MNNAQQSGSASERGLTKRRGCGCGAGLLLAFGAAIGAPANAHETDSNDESLGESSESSKGHGSISIGYQNTLVNGRLDDAGSSVAIGSVRIQSIYLGLDYFFADRWSIHAGLPFIESRYRGMRPHCPTAMPPQCQPPQPVLSRPHPESQFLDDGDFHGTWQDWTLGVSYYTNIGNYYITPSITALIPSHDYTFFAQAAVGQNLNKLAVGIALAHQFDFTEIYYSVGYAYVFAERTLGVSINHSRIDLELGYFLSPRLSVRLFSLSKFGGGLKQSELMTDNRTNEVWYHHDQISSHEYANLGLGVDYSLGDKYTLSASVQTLVWGRNVYNFKYSADLRLSREF